MKKKRSANPEKFLSPQESTLVKKAIEEAERNTSAELKMVIVRYCWDDIRDKAARIFKKMGLDKTEARNCAMVMLVTTNREFLIYGDEGIHEKVGQNFWDDVRDIMADKFKSNEFGEGLSEGISKIGEKLARFFPHSPEDKDEIPDDISYEK